MYCLCRDNTPCILIIKLFENQFYRLTPYIRRKKYLQTSSLSLLPVSSIDNREAYILVDSVPPKANIFVFPVYFICGQIIYRLLISSSFSIASATCLSRDDSETSVVYRSSIGGLTYCTHPKTANKKSPFALTPL